MSADLKKYIPVIDAIISSANPDEVSPKKIRKAIQELYGIKLDEKRKALNDLIVDRFEDILQNPRVLIKKADLDKKDEECKDLQKKVAHQADKEKYVLKSPKKVSKVSKAKTKKKKKTSTEEGAKRGMAARNLLLSEKLSKFLGVKEMPRTQVVKVVWEYIKKHDLQNPKDRREILCDEKMEPVFGKSMTMFSMNKILAKHLFNPKDLVDNDKTKVKVDKVKKEEV